MPPLCSNQLSKLRQQRFFLQSNPKCDDSCVISASDGAPNFQEFLKQDVNPGPFNSSSDAQPLESPPPLTLYNAIR